MKILLVTPMFPYPLCNGGMVAFFHVNQYLSQYHEMTVMTISNNQEQQQAIESLWQTAYFKYVAPPTHKRKSKCQKLRKKISTIKKRLLIPSQKLRTNPHLASDIAVIPDYFVTQVQQELDSNSYDLLVCELTPSMRLGQLLKTDIPKVFVHHELFYMCVDRTLSTLPFWYRLLLTQRKRQNKRKEIRWLRNYDNILVFSHQDRLVLQKEDIPHHQLSISPFAINPKLQPPVFSFSESNKHLAFVGNESHYPNYDAVHWFATQIWQKLHSRIEMKGQQLRVFSQWQQTTQRQLNRHCPIQFVGFVDDISTELRGHLLIVPLRIGSGIRTKILEAFASGIPVITTTIGVEGIAVENGVHCLIADTAADFSEAILKLMASPKLQQRLTQNAYKLIQQQYSLSVCGERRIQVMKDILEKHTI
ncbi:MAG: glycosyltransferase family 4 protein [Bacteroidota bacterium]